MKPLIMLLIFLCCALQGMAQVTLIPDPNFEQALIDLGIDSDFTVNGQVATSDVENITELNVAGRSIQDLTGIEDFLALEELLCFENELTSINLSSLENLTRLDIVFNQLTSIDISNNLSLELLSCGYNNINTLDVSSNTLLRILFAGQTDASTPPRNEISAIDLSNNPNLEYIIVSYLGLESLNLKNDNNGLLTMMEATNNDDLFCVQVDDEAAANNGEPPYTDWEVDPQVTYSEDCLLDIEDVSMEDSLFLYPNPAKDMVYLQHGPGTVVMGVSVYDVQGKLQAYFLERINGFSISSLPSGVYFIKVRTTDNIFVKKILKEQE